jgi:hypothetical protein
MIRVSCPIPKMSTVWHSDSERELSDVASIRRFDSLLGTWGTDAANIPADANLHPLPNQHRNALHQMRCPNEAGDDRTARSKLRCADLPLHALRFRREFPEGALDSTLPAQHGRSCLRQYKSILPHLDQAEFGQNAQTLVAARQKSSSLVSIGFNIQQWERAEYIRQIGRGRPMQIGFIELC